LADRTRRNDLAGSRLSYRRARLGGRRCGKTRTPKRQKKESKGDRSGVGSLTILFSRRGVERKGERWVARRNGEGEVRTKKGKILGNGRKGNESVPEYR